VACNKPGKETLTLVNIGRHSQRRQGAMVGRINDEQRFKAKSLQDLVRKPYVGHRTKAVPTSTTQPRIGL